jgi:hypothetical protein
MMIEPGGSRRAPWPPLSHRPSGLDQAAGPAGPLRGRGPRVEILGEVLDRVTAGRPALVLIEGEAGIGKTRLLEGTLEDARAWGMQVARGAAEGLERAAASAAPASAELATARALESFVRLNLGDLDGGSSAATEAQSAGTPAGVPRTSAWP